MIDHTCFAFWTWGAQVLVRPHNSQPDGGGFAQAVHADVNTTAPLTAVTSDNIDRAGPWQTNEDSVGTKHGLFVFQGGDRR